MGVWQAGSFTPEPGLSRLLGTFALSRVGSPPDQMSAAMIPLALDITVPPANQYGFGAELTIGDSLADGWGAGYSPGLTLRRPDDPWNFSDPDHLLIPAGTGTGVGDAAQNGSSVWSVWWDTVGSTPRLPTTYVLAREGEGVSQIGEPYVPPPADVTMKLWEIWTLPTSPPPPPTDCVDLVRPPWPYGGDLAAWVRGRGRRVTGRRVTGRRVGGIELGSGTSPDQGGGIG